jgi:hypothetical protein
MIWGAGVVCQSWGRFVDACGPWLFCDFAGLREFSETPFRLFPSMSGLFDGCCIVSGVPGRGPVLCWRDLAGCRGGWRPGFVQATTAFGNWGALHCVRERRCWRGVAVWSLGPGVARQGRGEACAAGCFIWRAWSVCGRPGPGTWLVVRIAEVPGWSWWRVVSGRAGWLEGLGGERSFGLRRPG